MNSVTSIKEEKDVAGGAAPRVRSYFPEALYINPEIVTDQDGRASIIIPMADSITTWRMAMLASTARGALGSGTASLKVFQDFFVDLDMPVTLTQGDRVSIPVAAYNYSGRGRRCRPATAGRTTGTRWWTTWRKECRGGIRPRRRRAIHAGSRAHRQVQADAFGAHGGRGESRRYRGARNRSGAQRTRAEHRLQRPAGERGAPQVTFPPQSIPDAGKVFVRLYPDR